MKLGVFLLPNGELNSQIIKWKRIIAEKIPDQPYTLHPPHLTLISLDIDNYDSVIRDVLRLSKYFSPFELNINKTDVFWNDSFTNGHTLFYGLKKNVNLYKLQKHVANILINYKKDNNKNIKMDSKVFEKSYKKYGSPFIGEHWIPHFSISSIQGSEKHSVIDRFLSTDVELSCMIDKITTWEINSDNHKQLDEFPLK
tara:strand:- start:37022 stop:37615 length:594 start_codon:yes stop_codon:yes gene_type:complete